MPNTLIIIFATLLLAGLLYFEKSEDRRKMLPTKTVLSALFVFTALVQPHPVPSYAVFIIIGLLCCLTGDVFLALPQEKMFLFGLVSFLIGHIFYVTAFVFVSDLSPLTWTGCILAIVTGIVIFRWLKPHLGSMKMPVACYILVITVMICGAWSILGTTHFAFSGRIMVFVGAISFYISDILVARDRFLKTEFFNRLVGLPLYYAGQFLIAFSVGALA